MKAKLLVVSVTAAVLISATAASASTRVTTSADLRCVKGGGAILDLSMENPGRNEIRIDPDFHVMLEIVRRGRQPGVVLFVFPAPTHATIPPGETRTFILELGTPDESSPGLDLSGARLLVDTEIWLAGRTAPIVRTFSFPGC
jgi:hypothetical protein